MSLALSAAADFDFRAPELRGQVRAFLAADRHRGGFVPTRDSWLSGWNERFSRELGALGWVGMTIPVEYGGHGRSALERHVVIEELLAAGAPVAAHWFADRQVAPALLRSGTEEQRRRYLPRIARGECYFALGLSEPDAGSDLASVRTRATRTEGGYLINGAKVWTSGAHHAHVMIVLARTAERDPSARHAGLSQLIVDLPCEGVSIRPIRMLTGEHHFNEVRFDDVFVPDAQVLGQVGAGWDQVVRELAFERSGPERILSTFPLLTDVVEHLRATESTDLGHAQRVLGSVLARAWALRRMSTGVARQLAGGEAPGVEAAMVKDAGTRFEGQLVEELRAVVACEPMLSKAGLPGAFAQAVAHTPAFTLRGGTNEVLRSIIAGDVLR